jgi:hypothetical protein
LRVPFHLSLSTSNEKIVPKFSSNYKPQLT